MQIYLILYIFSQNQQENFKENVKPRGSGRKNSTSKQKKQFFDIGQVKILEGYFQLGLTNPNDDSRDILAEELKVDVNRVNVWFQNRRKKVKDQEKDLKAREALHVVDYRRYESNPEVIFVKNKPILNNLITVQESLRSKGNSIPCPRAVQLKRPNVQTGVKEAAKNRLSAQNKK